MIKIGEVYENMGGGSKVRVVWVRGGKVMLADLRSPGGWFEMGEGKFRVEYSEKVERKEEVKKERKEETRPKGRKTKSNPWMPYADVDDLRKARGE